MSRKRQALVREQPGNGPPKETGPPRSPGPLMGSRTPCLITGPLTREEVDALPQGGPGPTRVYKHRAA